MINLTVTPVLTSYSVDQEKCSVDQKCSFDEKCSVGQKCSFDREKIGIKIDPL